MLLKKKFNFYVGELFMSNDSRVPVKRIITVIVAVIIVIIGFTCFHSLVGKNSIQTYQVLQPVSGEPSTIDKSGYYGKWWATPYEWPRAVTCVYNDIPVEGEKEAEAIEVTFNDGGTAKQSCMVRFLMPTSEQLRTKVHKDFNGNIENVKTAVKSHLINCCKAAAPLMSSSENQSARKAEYSQIVEEMLRKGLYAMRKVPVVLKDRTDEKGNPITVYATEIITDSKGMPVVAQASPLSDYGIQIQQFSVTETKYDDQILKQFAAKKDSFLAAEKSKADREAQVQERLMIEEKYKKEKAETEGIANKEMAKLTIEATQKVKVAEQAKLEAETKASQLVEVAKLEKLQAETKAQQDLSVADLQAQAATKKAEAIITLANAKQKEIEIAGALTEKDKYALEIGRDTKIGVATALSKGMTMPQVVMTGGADGKGLDTSNLMNMWLLKNLMGEEGINIANTPMGPVKTK